MAAIAVHQFAQCITCHAWSPDHSMIALCPNSNEVHIYRLVEEKWERIHVLQKHDQIIAGIDWSITSNRIVTVSHDRNSYVWTQETSVWVPTLVILRLNCAALCVQWSPEGNKFAVGSGAKTVCICYYEQENNWFSLLQRLLMENVEYSPLSLKALTRGNQECALHQMQNLESKLFSLISRLAGHLASDGPQVAIP